MNICYLIDVAPEKFKGGGQLHLTNLVRQMQISGKAGSRFAGQSFGGPSPNILIRLAWMIYVVPQVIFYHFFINKFDLVHAHSIPAMAAAKILSLILRIPIVVTVHGAWMKNWLEKFVLTRVKYDAQITVSRNFLSVPNVNGNVVYIPNGVDLKIFQKSHPSSIIHHPSSILFVGRKNDPAKGFKVLEEAMKLVKLEIPNTKLLVAGGNLPLEKVLSLYQKADLFVLPSLSEGFPLTLLEAWAAKLPVVATKVGELPYLVKDGINGYLVEPGSAGKLAAVIVKALKNNNLAKLGENGYNVARKFSWGLVARKTVKIYKYLLSTY